MVLLKASTKNFIVTVHQKKKKDRGTSKRVSHVAIIIRIPRNHLHSSAGGGPWLLTSRFPSLLSKLKY